MRQYDQALRPLNAAGMVLLDALLERGWVRPADAEPTDVGWWLHLDTIQIASDSLKAEGIAGCLHRINGQCMAYGPRGEAREADHIFLFLKEAP